MLFIYVALRWPFRASRFGRFFCVSEDLSLNATPSLATSKLLAVGCLLKRSYLRPDPNAQLGRYRANTERRLGQGFVEKIARAKVWRSIRVEIRSGTGRFKPGSGA